MYEPKMKINDNSVEAFIDNIEHPGKREDAYRLLNIFTEATGFPPKMWGPSIIGFGSYHYKYDSGHEGDAPLVGFSPRKAKISLYLMSDSPEREALLQEFGKHTSSKGCVYINKVADIDVNVLKNLIQATVKQVKEMYPDE